MSSQLPPSNALRALALRQAASVTFSPFSSPMRAASTTAADVTGTVGRIPVGRPVGGLRGGLLGFFLGFSIASTYASYYLLQEYKLASSLLRASVEDLGESTSKMSNHLRRIEAVEKELSRLQASGAVKEDVTKLRGEMKKIYDGLHVEILDLRAHVWGVEQDLHKSASHNSIRI